MSKNILVCVAWPYANADIHQGNITGSHLPGDIFSRYQRLAGNQVVMVSGADAHGTPVTISAEKKGVTPKEILDHYHDRFLTLFQRLGISYDLFTTTHTENHAAVAQDIFTNLLDNGFLFTKVTQQMYSEVAGRFLPDRYVEGTCPVCGDEKARGDQCDSCNTLFETPAELINPYSSQDNSALEMRETEHYFIDLPKLAEQGLDAWLNDEKKAHWRPHVANFARSWLEEGLISRAITRDMHWGVSVPVDNEGFDSKVMYVWFEAVIGYLSATIEWAKHNGRPDSWRDFWYDDTARSLYFIGKDNIPFHTIIWPAELLGVKGFRSDNKQAQLNLPYDVPANQFMNMEGRKISGSRNWGVWMLDALERHDPDPLRYYLTITMPETRDSEWTWQGYVTRINTELIANWGNLTNRVLKMTKRYFDGIVPDPGTVDEHDLALLAAVDEAFITVGSLYDTCKFRAAIQAAMHTSTLVNQYLETTAPWVTAKTDMAITAKSIYIALQAINGLKLLFAPVLPFTSQKLHEMLGETGQIFGTSKIETINEANESHAALTYDATVACGGWKRCEIEIGRILPKPSPLFKKLDDTIIDEELARLGISPTED